MCVYSGDACPLSTGVTEQVAPHLLEIEFQYYKLARSSFHL